MIKQYYYSILHIVCMYLLKLKPTSPYLSYAPVVSNVAQYDSNQFEILALKLKVL